MEKSKNKDKAEKVEPILLNEYSAAKLLAVSIAKIRRWRLDNTGPPFIKLNAAVRYRRSDIIQWLEKMPVHGGPKPLWNPDDDRAARAIREQYLEKETPLEPEKPKLPKYPEHYGI